MMKTKSKTRTKSTILFFGTVAIIFILAYLGFFGIDNIFGYQFKTFDQTINKMHIENLIICSSATPRIRGETDTRQSINSSLASCAVYKYLFTNQIIRMQHSRNPRFPSAIPLSCHKK